MNTKLQNIQQPEVRALLGQIVPRSVGWIERMCWRWRQPAVGTALRNALIKHPCLTK